jgi:hypothetical protein
MIEKTVTYPGKENMSLFPSPRSEGAADGPIECHERLGDTLKYDERQAA